MRASRLSIPMRRFQNSAVSWWVNAEGRRRRTQVAEDTTATRARLPDPRRMDMDQAAFQTRRTAGPRASGSEANNRPHTEPSGNALLLNEDQLRVKYVLTDAATLAPSAEATR